MKNESDNLLEENNKSDEDDIKVENEDMPKRPVSRYYRNRREAERNRRKGDRIYQDETGYYIRRPQSGKSFWEEFFGL